MGITTAHNYDRLLSSYDMGIVSVVEESGISMELKRFPPGRGFLPFAKYVPLIGSFATLRWHARPFEHFELERSDGSVEQYFACSSGTPPCYLAGFRSRSGEVLQIDRDAKRTLLAVTTAKGDFLHFNYDRNGHLVAVSDNRGRIVRYAYDGDNRLASVSYPSGEQFSYEYDSVHRLVAIYVAPNLSVKPKLVLRNEFQNGFLTSQTLPDGRVFRYDYSPLDKMKVQMVIVRPPTGPALQVMLYGLGSAVREMSGLPGSVAR